ncbi:MAG: glycosyltransferase [Actinomycetia bacterium]|nr:glycosyltransferase [Actinomycetes bacterium]
MKRRVCWLIKGLGPGGAEHLLVAEAGARDRERFHYECGYLLPWKSHLVSDLEALDVPVRCLQGGNDADLRWAARLRRWLLEEPFDILHVHSPYVAGIARLVVRSLPRRARPHLVSTEHNAWSTFALPTRVLNAVTAPFDEAVFTVSEETRASMWSPVRRHAETVLHGIDLARARTAQDDRDAARKELDVDDDTILAGTIANFREQKDYPNMLRAARVLADRGVPVKFCLVGQGPLETEIRALQQELRLDGTVTLTGFREDALRLLAACDLFVLSSRYEGLPVALMEALALGLPVVSTAVGGVAETLTDGVEALLVPAQRPDLLADAIEVVVRDDALRARLAVSAARLGDRFDVANSVRHIESRYDELLAR